MIDKDILAWAHKLGFSTAEVVRGYRPGSGLDRVIVTTRCPSCGTEATESLRWFDACQMRCGCGADFDGAIFRDYLSFTLGHHSSLPHGIRILPAV